MPKQPHFTPDLFRFFRQLKRHNNREWFQQHKRQYELVVRDPFLKFIEDFRPRLHHISPHFLADPRPTHGSLLRIYKDLRFRPDAPPYKTMAAARFPHLAWKQTQAPGFYLHLEPSKSFLGMGLWHPDPETRGRIRAAIIAEPVLWKRATRAKRFTKVCKLGGDSAKRMPPGFALDHPLADDLRRKDFICWTEFTDEQVCGADFLDQVSTSCESAGPFMEFLTRALELPWSSEERAGPRGVLSIESLTF